MKHVYTAIDKSSKGQDLMTLVHDLYQRAADEA